MTELPRTRAEQVALLRAAIARSGLSARQFATTVLLRDERTCRRWLAGDSPIPAPVLRWLRHRWPDDDGWTALETALKAGDIVRIKGRNFQITTTDLTADTPLP